MICSSAARAGPGMLLAAPALSANRLTGAPLRSPSLRAGRQAVLTALPLSGLVDHKWLLNGAFLIGRCFSIPQQSCLKTSSFAPDIGGQAAQRPSSCLLYKLPHVPSSLPSVPLSLNLSPELQAPQRGPEPPQASPTDPPPLAQACLLFHLWAGTCLFQLPEMPITLTGSAETPPPMGSQGASSFCLQSLEDTITIVPPMVLSCLLAVSASGVGTTLLCNLCNLRDCVGDGW